jgi:hypothetical protein
MRKHIIDLTCRAAQHQGMRPVEHPVVRRRWWLTPRAAALIVVAVLVLVVLGIALLRALWAWGRLPSDSEDTVWVSLSPNTGRELRPRSGTGADGVVVVTVLRPVADLGPFGERVAALVAPADHRSPGVVVEDGRGLFSVSPPQVDVHLAAPLLPRRVDTQAVQQELAAAGFRWLVVDLDVEERAQVMPQAAAQAGECWGDQGLSCEWRIATGGPPLGFEVRAVSSG